MRRRPWLRAALPTLAAGLGSLSIPACGPPPDGDSSRLEAEASATALDAAGMSLVLITLDTTRADFLSCLGGDPGLTPNLDALAERSALFTRAWSETNITNPSHVTMMTGMRAIDHGVMNNRTQIPERVDTLAEALGRAGYRTVGLPSVRHLGSDLGWRGFDRLETVRGRHRAESVSTLAVQALERARGEPLFLWVHYWDPHVRYDPPPEIAEAFYDGDPTTSRDAAPPWRLDDPAMPTSVQDWLEPVRDPAYPTAMYAAEIHYVDREIGRLLAALDALELRDRTVVVVVSDHGESLGEHGIYFDHGGLYEPQLRIPLLIYVPGMKPGRFDAPVSTLDLAPTLTELLGVELGNGQSGVSLAPLLRGDGSPALDARGGLIHQHAHNHAVAVREGNWKLIWPIHDRPTVPKEPLLFDLARDPGELENLAHAHPERVARMKASAKRWVGAREDSASPLLSPEALEQLRELGYVTD